MHKAIAPAIMVVCLAGVTGCSQDVVAPTQTQVPLVATSTPLIAPTLPDDIASGEAVFLDAPVNPFELTGAEENEIREFLAWWRTLTPEDRKNFKKYIAYRNALNGTGPSYGWTGANGYLYFTSQEGTSVMGPLR